jgi:hypothetical protein
VSGRPENVRKARQRNGIVATISQTKRVGCLRVRGSVRMEAFNNGRRASLSEVNISRVSAGGCYTCVADCAAKQFHF